LESEKYAWICLNWLKIQAEITEKVKMQTVASQKYLLPIQIIWLLVEDVHLETKRSNEGE
jgi:hypothetical protein